MINFFRKKRKKLADDNKAIKYTRYAIGEIVLVVIGILIALSINNWNEIKKNKNQAAKNLITLKLNLQDDVLQIEKLLSITKTGLLYSNTLLNQFKTITPADENVQMYIISLMLEHQLEVNSSGFESLKNTNSMIFLNEKLKVNILNYYRLIEQLKSREQNSNADIKSMYEPYVKQHYNWIYNKTNPWPRQAEFYKDDPRLPIKIDYKKILSDKQLEVMVFGRRWQLINLKNLYAKTIMLAEEIVIDIENSNTTTNHD